LASLRNAVLMLRTRLVMLEEWMRLQSERASAEQPLDLVGLRQLAALTRSLPALATFEFADQLATSFNDASLLAYLASITRTLDQANSLVGTSHSPPARPHAP
jgi:hypothetical protein